METNYGTNSNRSKEAPPATENREEKKVEKVVSGSVKVKKKNKFAEAFIKEDMGNVKEYIFVDVIVPTIKNLILDTTTNALSMILNGEARGTSRTRATSNVNYRGMYDRRPTPSRGGDYRRGFDFDEIIFSSRADAEEVLSQMYDILDQYHSVRVTDFYELAGVTGDYTGNRYGWTDLRSASVDRDRDGYIVRLPRPIPLDR